MPYLSEKRKRELDNGGRVSLPLTSAGDLTYRIYKLAKDYNIHSEDQINMPGLRILSELIKEEIHDRFLGRKASVRYEDYAIVLGSIRAAWFEGKRRRTIHEDARVLLTWIEQGFYLEHVAPYEDKKIEENGDVE